ncbi:hypothetical protein DYB37_008904 [Aphanomyces astaci]|uniref:Polymerase nucleotidyl transferase domain-containing protein n=1 Tax=Aphanomyces astaci TaxID=112090 RepID=A0A3R7BSK9_APHAT|nr:hypothetical protein DYB37_008904 [Aphanomyces astaci]
MERCMRLLNPSILGCPALRQVDAMINQAFGPTLESERVHAKLLRYLRHILDQGQCSYSITPPGSYPLKTYLPDSDIDVCLEVPDAAATWHLAVTQALIGAATPPYAKEAKAWLVHELKGAVVTVTLLRRDQYGRAGLTIIVSIIEYDDCN